ncbi:MAG: LCP family protein [Clostridia bacterium]|nr:LCP family protein [Clostridia bacterium]
MKRFFALLLCLALVLPLAASAEEEEEVSISELTGENLALDEEGNIIDGDDDPFDFSDDELEMLAGMEASGETVDRSQLEINENLPDDVINILLLGLDVKGTQSEKLLSEQGKYAKRADVQMILSINTIDGSLKLTSIARNTCVDIPDRQNETLIANSYGHAVYENGKYKAWVDTPYMCMATINRNFEMNIEHYVAINFYGVASIIEYLGGADVELTKAEASYINSYLKKHKKAISNTYDDKKGNRDPLEKVDGVQHLDGLQALMYARTRDLDSDFGRTGRTRKLMNSLLTPTVQRIKSKELDVLNLAGEFSRYLISDMNPATMVSIAMQVLQGDVIQNMSGSESLIEEFRLPVDGTWAYGTTAGGASVNKFKKGQKQVNTEMLHEFIYGAYYPSGR